MKEIEYKLAKNFKEILNTKSETDFFEVFVLTPSGATAKRRLARCRLEDGFYCKRLILVYFDTYGRMTTRFTYQINSNNKIDSNVLYDYEIVTTSRDFAYKHCMEEIKKQIKRLRGKECQLHRTIYHV